MESLTSGTLAGTGSFRCEECGYVVTLAAADALPTCPGCGSASFALQRPAVRARNRAREDTGGARGLAGAGAPGGDDSRPVPRLRARRQERVDPARARVDPRRPQPGRGREVRRPDRLAAPCA